MTPELLEAGRDIEVFAQQILGVKLNPAQLRWLRAITKKGGWDSHISAWVSANQVGKSLGIAILILWACVYKIGVKNDTPEHWAAAPYHWFHVAPTQQQAYIPLKDIELLVRGVHPSQDVGKELYGLTPRFPEKLVHFEKLETYYDGFSTITGAFAQFRTTEEKAKALQGRRANGISFDEAAFEQHLRVVINEALMMRLISTGGPLIIVSTPNGINDFFEIVQQIKDAGILIPNSEAMAWKTEDQSVLVWSTIADNAGYGISEQEIERMERDLDPATKEQQLRGAFLEPLEAFFVPTQLILDAFKPDMPTHVEPQKGHTYIIAWDPSVSSDPTSAIVIDVTSKPWKCVHESWNKKPSGIQSLLSEMFGLHYRYGSEGTVFTVYDSTGMGGKIISQSLYALNPKRGLDTAGSSSLKLNMLANLRAALTKRELWIPETWVGLKRELLNYRLEDKNIQTDRVMALSMGVWIASKGYSEKQVAAFNVGGRIVESAWR